MIILGLDGVSRPLLDRLVQTGCMPNLAGLIPESYFGPMNSTWPEISPVAWTTFFTAKTPAEHGIFGFTDFKPGGYELRFTSSMDVRAPNIWDWLSMRGKRSMVLNVPLTYPAKPIGGVMISGFVALDYDRAAHPKSEADWLRRTGYRLEADFERVHQDRDAFLADLDQALAGRERLLDRYWGQNWDMFTLVVTDTDRLQHFFLREFEENGPITDYFLDFMHRVDRLAGVVIERTMDLSETGDPTALVMLSDHGFAPVKEEFHLNRWLAANGYLPEVGPAAAALALDPTRIYLNRPPRFGLGRLSDASATQIAGEITAGLLREPAVADVMRGVDIYSGPLDALAPDIVARPAPGYEFKAKFNQGPVYTPSPLMGTHTFENAFFLVKTWNVEDNASPPIMDISDLGRLTFRFFDL